ncbi:MAG: thiol:disulfide interchange protein DsbA/DsbL [Pseudomonadota bacterium]
MKKLKTFLAGAALFAFMLNVQAQMVDPKYYTVIDPPMPTAAGEGKIEVAEIFWYSCPHCYGFESYISDWKKDQPEDVHLEKIPAVFKNGRWEHFAQAYYAAEVLGVLDKMHVPIFEALHEPAKRRRLRSAKEFQPMFAEYGVNEKQFYDTFNSFAVDNKVRFAQQRTVASGATGVPAVIVNGKYLLSTSTINGYAAMLKVADELVNQERAAMRQTAQSESSTQVAEK